MSINELFKRAIITIITIGVSLTHTHSHARTYKPKQLHIYKIISPQLYLKIYYKCFKYVSI